jgi:lycopene cyclase domain-containing protein
MTYLLLNSVFLAVTLIVAACAFATRRLTLRALPGMAIALIAVFVLTAVFDNVMIAVGLFGYDAAHVTGFAIGRAPLEDFAYPLAAVILLPSLWALLGGSESAQPADRGANRMKAER